MNPFNTVVFDFDGLVVDTEPLYQRAFNSVLTACRVPHQYDAVEYGRLFVGRSLLENVEYIRQEFNLPQPASTLAEAYRALYHLLISDPANVEPMPGLMPLLHQLHARKIRVGVASGSRQEFLETIVRQLKLDECLPLRVGNNGQFAHKPAPDVYLDALRRLSADPHTTVALEDSSSGIRAARAAGLYAIAVRNQYTRHQDFSMAHLVVDSLSEAQAHLNLAGEAV